MRVGVTGHQDVVNVEWVRDEMRNYLTDYRRVDDTLIGISSLAVGADQLFAQAVLDCLGSLEVVLPFERYEETLEPSDRQVFLRLLRRAGHVDILKGAVNKELAYLAAGQYVARNSDVLMAIWDGDDAAGVGGTADIVAYARSLGRSGIHINPTLKSVAQL